MANYEASARTNYFKVEDIDGLKTSLERFQLILHPSSEDGYYCILSDYEGGWGEVVYLEDDEDEHIAQELEGQVSGEEEIIFNFEEHVMPFVEVGQVVVAQEVGYEKLRYLVGQSAAFIRRPDDTIETISINLDEIYDLAKEKFGVEHVTTATY